MVGLPVVKRSILVLTLNLVTLRSVKTNKKYQLTLTRPYRHLESFSYEWETYGTELRYEIDDIYSTNHSAQNHCSTNQNCLDTARTVP